jgi:hypothetical protein
MKYRDFLKWLEPEGVREYRSGKGSERILIREMVPGSGKGPQYSMKCHGEGKDIARGTMMAALRRLDLKHKIEELLH